MTMLQTESQTETKSKSEDGNENEGTDNHKSARTSLGCCRSCNVGPSLARKRCVDIGIRFLSHLTSSVGLAVYASTGAAGKFNAGAQASFIRCR